MDMSSVDGSVECYNGTREVRTERTQLCFEGLAGDKKLILVHRLWLLDRGRKEMQLWNFDAAR